MEDLRNANGRTSDATLVHDARYASLAAGGCRACRVRGPERSHSLVVVASNVVASIAGAQEHGKPENPAKLQELQQLFWTEAQKHQVLPLDASVGTRLVAPRQSLGDDTGMPGAEDYELPFPFTGRLAKLELTIDRPRLTAAAQRQLEEAMKKQATEPESRVGGTGRAWGGGMTRPDRPTPVVTTIGYEGTTVPQFLETLKAAGVRLLVDVRAVAASRRPGFSKTRLAANLEEAGIGYVHLRGLGTPAEGRAAARAGKHDEMRRVFSAHLATHDALDDLERLVELVETGTPLCLLCFEAEARHCHRRLVAEAVAVRTPIEVRDLMPGRAEAD